MRPHLEFASSVWNPHLQSDIEALERVQRRASKIPYAMESMSYEDRLSCWGLTSLEERRKRGDLIQLYKMVNNLEHINWFTRPRFVSERHTRSHERNRKSLSRDAFPSRARSDFGHGVTLQHEFFLKRITGRWNGLSDLDVDAPSLDSFKARIDKHSITAATA